MTDVHTRPPTGHAVRDEHHDRLYVAGRWREPAGTRRIDVLDAATEEVAGSVPEGSVEDVDRAVQAAHRALPAWSATAPGERAEILSRVAAELTACGERVAALVSTEVGMPLHQAVPVQGGLPPMVTATYASLLAGHPFEETVGNSLVVREAVGVVAAITPWNYPLYQAMCKVAPALAAGCTVVLKPSELAPLTAFVLAEVMERAGVPDGVFNLVTGTGAVAGEALASHPLVDMVSVTGSTRTGRRVAELAARTVKRTTLELGGKSANVILEGADLRRAVEVGVNRAFLNSGQTCAAWSRMLVPRARQDEAVDVAVETAGRLPVGDPFAPETMLGPLVSAAQRERVLAYIEGGRAQGARLVTGGVERPDGLPRGYYVRPTIFAGVAPGAVIAQEEIFGPVLAIIPYRTDDEAVEIANGTIYGLAGAVWAADRDRALAVARRMRCGQVDLNGASFNPLAPFGGYRQSGLGRELGRHGLDEFLEVKSLQL